MWIQHSPKFRIIVQFTQDGKSTIRRYIENGDFVDFVDVREVQYTLKELEAAQVATQLIIRNLDILTNSGINVSENKVELFVVERSRFNVVMQDAKIQLPPQVIVVTVSELSNQETNIYGGLVLSDGTSGFSVINSSGVKGITTAAHCENTILYNGVELPFQASAYGGSYDFQWHTAPGFIVRNLIFDGTNERFIFSTKHRDNQAVGEWVCKYGKVSGYTCGYIIDKNFNPGGAMGSTLIRVHREGYNLSALGDSGGPWFFSNTAYGSHVGGISFDAYYMAINYIDILGLSLYTVEVALPIVIKEETLSLEMENSKFVNSYPSYGEEESIVGFPSISEPYP